MKVFIDPRSTINYSSYYIQGLYDLYGKNKVRFSAKYFKTLREIDMLMAFVIKTKTGAKRFIIDYRDQTDIIGEAYEWCDVYAKINIDETTLFNDNNKLRSIPPSFGIRIWNPLELSYNLCLNFLKAKILTHINDKNIHLRPLIWGRNYLSLLRRQKLDCYTSNNKEMQRNYVFFVSTFWQGCFNTNSHRADYILSCFQQNEIDFEGGFFVDKGVDISKEISEDIPKKIFFHKYFSNISYIRNIKKSIFVFNTPAVHNCHGWKLGEFLAMGKAIISTPLRNKLPYPLEDRKDIYFVETKDEIKDAVLELLKDEKLRTSLEQNARDYYEIYASPIRVIEYLVK